MFQNFALLLLLNSQNEVLLLRRINTTFSNLCYSLPGGKIELGETASKAIIREAKNSIGINIKPEDLEVVHVIHRKCNEPEFFSVIFKSKKFEGILKNLEPTRHDDMKWFSINNLPKNIVSAHLHAIKQIQKNKFYSEHGWESIQGK
jgi:ADP-ribose pyrophosphatase YjhB (NUDIX family)